MLKKISIILISFLLMISMCGKSNATDLKTSLDVMQKASETKYLENDQGFISKTIVDSNADTGEITIELKLSNTKKELEATKDTEVFLVVDNSPSMDFVTASGKTRKEIVLDSASKLVKSIYNISSNVKMGLIDFHGGSGGIFGERIGINNAIVRQELIDNQDNIISAIDSELERSTKSGTNIEAGLRLASKKFSQNSGNKVVILLTDGIPNADVDGNGVGDITSDEGIIIQNNTKQAILDLKANGIYTITMLTGMSETDGNTDKSGHTYTDTNTIEEQLEAAERIFGTQENPTADKYYLVSSTDINKVVTTDILNDVSEKIQNPINDVKIVDYFPDDITENFDFSYVENAKLGTITDDIDKETNTITWNIETLKDDEEAVLRYKLKIKDMKNTKILNKTIATNEKIVLTYKDSKLKDYIVELTSSPKIKLSEIKEELTATVSYDPTTSTTGKVTATIKTNKKVNKVDGWNISEDGKILTKIYSENKTETVHLVDEDDMTKDVEIKITNIIQEETKKEDTKKEQDKTTAKERLPQTGMGLGLIASIVIILVIAVISYAKYKEFT